MSEEQVIRDAVAAWNEGGVDAFLERVSPGIEWRPPPGFPQGDLWLGRDELRRRGLKVVGHNKSAAMLEGSKIVAKQFMARNDIPTVRFTVCHSAESARAAVRLESFGLPFPVKGHCGTLGAGFFSS